MAPLPYTVAYDDIFDTESGRETFDAVKKAVASFGREFTCAEVLARSVGIRGCVDS
ncbi:hypothetical protein [Rosistilla oblonga]|uniref:hypothetical protein n=1 Tax=Rosistilla oblonga TaxID=2527990 RepID=UPI003A98102C